MAKILIVDDQKEARQLLVTLLGYGGHRMFEASDGAEALEEVRRTRPDLIVADVLMPNMDGPEFIQRLREEKDGEIASTPVIFCTAFADAAGMQERSDALAVHGIISKPVETEALLKSVNATLALNAARGSLRSPGQSTLVLVVDDKAENLLLARSILEPFGYQVITAKTINEGFRLACEIQPDIILSDVNLRNESGYYFINLVKAKPELADIPFVFLSSSSSPTLSRTHAEAQKADRFIMRPIEPEIFLTLIKSCLTKRPAV